MEIWQLIIDLDSGRSITLMGSEEILRGEFEGWIKFKNDGVAKWSAAQRKAQTDGFTPAEDEIDDPAEYVVRVVHGFTDTANRAPLEIAYRFVKVDNMALVKMI